MENKILTGIVALLVILQGYQLVGDREPTHYCESREIRAYCYELSSTLKTCYTLPAKTGGKRCSEWKEIPFIEKIEDKVEKQFKEYICPKRPNPCKELLFK